MSTDRGRFTRAAVLMGAIGLSAPALAADIRSDTDASRSVVSITGPIEAGDYDRFLDTLDRGRPDLVVLISPGGNLAEGVEDQVETTEVLADDPRWTRLRSPGGGYGIRATPPHQITRSLE